MERRPDDNEPLRQAKIAESLTRGDKTSAAERAKTMAKNQSFSDPMGASALYTPHPMGHLMDAVNTTVAPTGGMQGPTPSGAPLGTVARGAGQGPYGTTGSWEPMNNANGSFNPQSSKRPLPPALTESIHSPHIQGQLDASAGMTRSPIAGTSQITPYGTASSTFSNAPQTAAVVTSTGVVHPAASDPVANAQARLALQQSHPEVFQPGTPQNKAFTDYALANGEAAAHQNIQGIMSPFAGPVAAATTSAAPTAPTPPVATPAPAPAPQQHATPSPVTGGAVGYQSAPSSIPYDPAQAARIALNPIAKAITGPSDFLPPRGMKNLPPLTPY